MQEIRNLLNNPIIRNGLRLASPEIAIGVELIASTVSLFTESRKHVRDEKRLIILINVIDKKLALILKSLAVEASEDNRRLLEIRALELLGVLVEWEKLT